MGISIFDFMFLFLEANSINIKVFSTETNEVVYEGFYADAPAFIKRSEVQSVDNPFMDGQDFLTINI